MADNVDLTPGTGVTAWTDEVAGPKHAQVIKIADGTANGTDVIPGDAVRGLAVKRGLVFRLTATPTISASAIYAQGDAVGGLLTFTGAARVSGAGLWLRQAVIIDLAQQLAPLDLVLFDRTFTASSNNAVFDPSDADLANVLTVVPITTYSSFSDNSVGISPVLDLPLILSGTSLFGQLIARSTPTYAATSDLTVALLVYQE